MRGDHGDFIAQADKVFAEVKRVAFQPAYFGWKVNALLQDLHAGFQSSVRRGLPVKLLTTMSAMRSPARPSPYGFTAPDIFWRVPSSDNTRAARSMIFSRSVPTSADTPARTPSGRSVTSRITRTGTPKVGASSWMPPESVSASADRRNAYRRSR